MRSDDFFERTERVSYGMTLPARRFRVELVHGLRQGPLDGVSDVQAAVALARLLHDELEAFGTDGGQELDDHDVRDGLLALQAVAARLGLEVPTIPFRNLTTFRSFWIKRGAKGSWQARRDLLDEIFDGLHDALADLESRTLASGLAEAISPRGRTGWARVDEEIAELRRHFHAAQTEDVRIVVELRRRSSGLTVRP